MTLSRVRQAAFSAGLLYMLLAHPALGAFSQHYGNFTGRTIDFLDVFEETMSEDIALYKHPVMMGNQQLFFPTAFVSEASNGLSDVTSGTLTMTLRAHDGYAISKVTITEIGNATLQGTGTNATSAALEATLTVNDQTALFAAGPYRLPNDSFTPFSLTRELVFSGFGVTEASFSLINALVTTSEPGTTAKIQKQVLSDNVRVEVFASVVPIPGAALLFGTGGGLFSLVRILRSRKR